jgi:hypothetical protein
LTHRSRTIDSGRLGPCGTDGVAIAEYRIICVVRRADGHLRAVGYSANGNAVMYDDLWSVAQAREAIEEGHRLYTVSPATGEQADLELHADGIRTRLDESTDHTLDDLPPCG